MARAESGDGFLRDSLGNFMRRASAGKLPWGWLHLPNGEITGKTRCLLVTEKAELRDEERETTLQKMGFPREGLETNEMREVAAGVERLTPHPTDEDYARGFLYFWRYQSLLPALVEKKPVATAATRWRRDMIAVGNSSVAVDRAESDERIWRLRILDLMQLASADLLPLGWTFLDSYEPKADSRCLLVLDDLLNENSDATGDRLIEELGFPHSGIGTPAATGLAKRVHELEARPTDAQMLDAFEYYLHFLEAPASLDPNRQPPIANWTRRARVAVDHQLWTHLKGEPERPDIPCRKPGCTKGAIPQSVFCREHHFEMMQGRPYPKNRYDFS
jgi:hypothetical protein